MDLETWVRREEQEYLLSTRNRFLITTIAALSVWGLILGIMWLGAWLFL